MTYVPEQTNTNLNGVDIFNAVRNASSTQFQSAVPSAYNVGDTLPDGRIATRADVLAGLRDIGQAIMTYPGAKNEFLSNLINRIAFVVVSSKLFDNPLATTKKGILEYGETIEEIFVAMAEPYQYDPASDFDKVFQRHIPDVQTAFHSMNFQKLYPTTVGDVELRTAFLSIDGVTDLTNKIVEQLYHGAYYDEFLVTKYMICRAALDGEIAVITIPTPEDEVTAKKFTSKMIATARNMAIDSRKYNYANVMTNNSTKNLFNILTNDISAELDVQVLAMAFQMSKAELIGRQLFVDIFTPDDEERLAKLFEDDPYTTYAPFTSEEKQELSKISGMLCDEEWFKIYDKLLEMTSIYNPTTLEWNYNLHKWSVFSFSPFCQAVIFTSDTPGITSVTVNPPTASVKKGSQLQLNATVENTAFASKRVFWEITGSEEHSTVDQTGLVTVGANETEPTLTVKATSLVNDEKYGECTITVTE